MTRPIAFVLMQNPTTLNPQALVDVLRQRHPERSWDEELADAKNPERAAPAFIRCGECLVSLMSIDAPIPLQDDLWTRAAIIWPEAREEADRHRAHIIVAPLGGDGADLELARIVTAVTGGLVSITQSVCAVVMGGRAARSAELWQQMSQDSFAPYPDYPVSLWVDIAPFKSGQSVAAFTAGLGNFVGREIEFEVPGMDYATTIERVDALVGYLIEHGDVIKDGQTFGTSETDRIKVRHGVSRFNGSAVLRVGA